MPTGTFGIKIKNGWPVPELTKQTNGSILKRVYLLFEVFRFKNVCNKMDNISRHSNGHVK
jgi:hypothetical protein